MNCEKCNQPITIKNTEKFISVLCKCEILLIYPSKITKIINKKDYNPHYKEER